ncbi:hypothetical protein [Acinetobacter junii]|uniref:hypothetical protein n=1 Tax=Acinetobacter junii TaxID=40215 RepID=UPI0012508BBE|nr:hypothetical protein [Acinetobacter junii]
MSNQIELIEFKAGNSQEIKQSIANFCQVSIREINRVNIKEIYEKYRIEYHGISDALWEKFNEGAPLSKSDNLRAIHYHKTRSNGTKEWFQDGLKNGDLGVKNFIYNLNHYCDIDLTELEGQIINSNNKKHEQANEGINYGPYSFICRKSAMKDECYNLPETIGDNCGVELLNNIRNALKPTVVEFWFDYPTSCALDKYLRAYCGMFLYGEFPYSPLEPRMIVPYENIKHVKIVRVRRKPLRNKLKEFKMNVDIRFTMDAN